MSDLYEMCEDLEEAAKLCNDELGEWWSGLAYLYSNVQDCGSNEFLDAYEKQVRSEYERLQNEFRIEEETVTETVTYRTLRHESE